jgi:hypothetical protein
MLESKKVNNLAAFIISFVISLTVVLLIASHLKHSITNALFSSDPSDIAFVDEPQTKLASNNPQSQNKSGCGCPSCCAVSEML